MRILLTGVLEDGTSRRESVPVDPRANVSITKGANVEIVVTVVTPGGEPVKLTGIGTELLLTVKKRPSEAATISRLAISAGNVGTFTLVPTDTRTQIAGLYSYDIWLTKDGKRDIVIPLSPFNLLEANAAIPADGSLPPVPPSGNLVGGPGSSTDSAVALWDGVDGDLLKNSVIIVDGAGNITVPGTVDGRDVSADGGVLDSHVGNTSNPHVVTAAQAAAIPAAEKGAASGVATLDGSVLVPDAQIPASITRDSELTAHTTDTTNPHTVTAAQVGNGVAQWNADQLQGNAVSVAAPSLSDVLTWDGSAWAPAVGGGGGISGPVSSTDHAIPRWDGTGGDTLLDSGITISDGDLLQFGGLTATEPALKKLSSVLLGVRNAIDTASADITARNVNAETGFNAVSAGKFRWSGKSNIFSRSDGEVRFTNNSDNDFFLLGLGPAAAGFPSIKRQGSGIDIRNAVDSAFTDLAAASITANSDSIRVTTPKTPASASDTGTTGQITWDSNFIYVAVATNTWKRVAISTW